MCREKNRNVYCWKHNVYKFKNAHGSFVCVLCMVDEYLDGGKQDG